MEVCISERWIPHCVIFKKPVLTKKNSNEVLFHECVCFVIYKLRVVTYRVKVVTIKHGRQAFQPRSLHHPPQIQTQGPANSNPSSNAVRSTLFHPPQTQAWA